MEVIGFICVSLGSSIVQLHGSLGNRRACTCSEAGFSSQNGYRARGIYYRRAAFSCAFLWSKDSMHIKKCFLFMARSVCRLKRFTIGPKNCYLGDKCFADDEEVETEVRKWLRQKPKDSYAAGFDALVKRWAKCISVGGGYVEKYMFSPGSNITCFNIHL
jgi:hypothetical protein